VKQQNEGRMCRGGKGERREGKGKGGVRGKGPEHPQYVWPSSLASKKKKKPNVKGGGGK